MWTEASAAKVERPKAHPNSKMPLSADNQRRGYEWDASSARLALVWWEESSPLSQWVVGRRVRPEKKGRWKHRWRVTRMWSCLEAGCDSGLALAWHQNLFIELIHLRVLNVDGRNAGQFEMIESSHQQTLSDTEFQSWPPTQTQTHDPNQHGRPYCQTTESWEVWFLLCRLSHLFMCYTFWIWTAKDCERLRTDLKERLSTMSSIARAKGVAECGKETNTRFFFFRGLLDTPSPSTFLIEYVFPRLMSFFLKKIQKIYM